MTKEQYETVNGFSNIFYGWGGEDDDLYNRSVNVLCNILCIHSFERFILKKKSFIIGKLDSVVYHVLVQIYIFHSGDFRQVFTGFKHVMT